MIEFGPKKRMEVECMKFTKFMASGIYQLKLVRFLLILSFIVHSCLHVVQIYLFLFKLKLTDLAQYGPSFFLLLYAMTANFVLLYKPKLVDTLPDDLYLWELNSSTEETETKIKFELRIIETFTKVCTVILIFLLLEFFIRDKGYEELFLIIKFINKTYPQYSYVLMKAYKFWICIIVSTSQTHCLQVVYYSQHMRYQLLMLFDHIALTTECPPELYSETVHPIDNVPLQQEIKRRCIFMIKRQDELLEGGIKKIKEISNLIVLFAFSILLAGISLCYRVLTSSAAMGDTFELVIRLGYASLVGAAFPLAGQISENCNDQVAYVLQQLDWYNANKENRQIYLLTLLRTQHRITIKCTERYSINFELGLAVLRGIYAVVSVLLSLNLT